MQTSGTAKEKMHICETQCPRRGESPIATYPADPLANRIPTPSIKAHTFGLFVPEPPPAGDDAALACEQERSKL